jgi:RHS repeat-associated protein
MAKLFYVNGFNVAPDELVYREVDNPGGGQWKPAPPGNLFQASTAAVSPDESKILFRDVGDAFLYLVNFGASTSTRTALTGGTGGSGPDSNPRWATSGTKIAFVRPINYGSFSKLNIHTINADGTGQTNISQSSSYDDDFPDWSPDGSKVAFISNRSGNWEIYVGNTTNLTTATRIATLGYTSIADLTWSPDGQKLAFSAVPTSGAASRIYTINADGTGLIQVGITIARFPAWSPDSTQVAYLQADPGDPGNLNSIYLVSANGGSSTFVISAGIDHAYQLHWRPVVGVPNHDGGAYCPLNHQGNRNYVGNPISVQDGEKSEEITDFKVVTPAGELSFTRSYRSSRRYDASFQFMGLGWTHNHNILLKKIVGSPNVVLVIAPNGGEVHFTETSPGSNQYNGDPGSTSSVTWNGTVYTLTASDKSTYTFDSAGRLTGRTWPTGEAWTYAYTSGKLTEVADNGYSIDGTGLKRKLQFSYITNPGQYNDGQLWRVGDHTAAGLSTTTPSGRYIEFSYTQQRSNGALVATPKALLASVKDVRGNTWTYNYYGQQVGETTAFLLDFLTERVSPSVDLSGDGTADGTLSLEKVTYNVLSGQISDLTQVRGSNLLTTKFTFQAGGQNITTEETAGKVTTHRFIAKNYIGVQDPAGNYTSRSFDGQFRVNQQLDPNGHATKLTWSADGKRLTKVEDALSHVVTLDYNTNDTVNFTLDSQNRKTEYTYGDINNPRLPTRIKIYDTNGTTVLQWMEFTYDNKGRTLTEKLLKPSDGVTLLQQVTRDYYPSGNGNGLLYHTVQKDVGGSNDVTTTYTYDSAGRVVKVQQSSNFGSCDISYTVYDAAGNVVATICNYDPGTGADPTTAAEAAALYNSSLPDKNKVTTYEYDTLGRRVKTTLNAGSLVFKQDNLTVYDALNRVIRTITNYKPIVGVTNPYTAARSTFDANHGTDNTQNLVVDTAYNARGMVKSQTDVLGKVTLFGYDDAGRLVKTIQNAGQAWNNDYMIDSNHNPPDPALANYVPNNLPDQDIITTQAYDAAGNLVKTVDALGVVSYIVYDALNRPVKTVRAAKDTATIALNPGDVGYDSTLDPRSDSYAPSTSPDRDLIDTTEYDAQSRVIRTKRLLENRGTSAQWETTLYGYDALGRQVKAIRSASQPTYNLASDPSLASYSASGNSDQDIVTQTFYDPNSRVMYTQDALGANTWVGYDGLGRQVKTVANAVGTASDGGVNDPRSSSYSPSSAADKDIVSVVVYDSSGRVQSTQDALGRVTRNVYDTVGRVIRTITNYVAQGATDPKDWVWSTTNNRWEYGTGNTTAISHGTDNDQNIISDTVYDAQGRVSATLDNRHNATVYIYDILNRRKKTVVNYVGSTDPTNWLWSTTNNRWEDGSGNAISFGTGNDQNRISTTTYDAAGRVTASRDAAGRESRYSYDALNRRTQTIVNYVDGVFSGAAPDEDLISSTAYNKASQVVSATDARGTQTSFTYDKVGRRLTVVQASNTSLASTSYSCYDKAGRVLRTIQNWTNDANQPAPDAQDGSGNWLFVPAHNGGLNDRNLVTVYEYDLASRRTKSTNPLGEFSTIAYFKDGQVQSMTDPEGVVTRFAYDGLRRRLRVVQGYVAQGTTDPKDWVWSASNNRWEYGAGNTTAIAHGTNNDQNIIVDVTYDKAGRVLNQRHPRGYLTSYAYDQLDRRKSLTNPLSKTWSTAYTDLAGGTSRMTLTYPGITGSANYTVQRDFDHLGRLMSIAYGAPSVTPDVKFTFNAAGDPAKMTEYSGAGFTSPIRETQYTFDKAHRLKQAAFDTDGNGTIDESVSYEYDAGGLRTKLTLPGSLNVVYTYDAKGQLVSLTDWDSQQTQFAYDLAGRHVATDRANGLRSNYNYDPAGRLKLLRHSKDFRTLGYFEYQVDKRGNRVQALEALAQPSTTTDTTVLSTDKALVVAGTWSDVSGFKESTEFGARLGVVFFGNEATLTMGTGPDHSIYDVYVGGSLWQSFDGYASVAGQQDIVVTIGVDSRKLQGEGPHVLEIRNRVEKNKAASGNKVRFKQLLVVDRTYNLHTIEYAYDNLSRLLEARYNPGSNTAAADADLLRRYLYTYDRSGNRLSQSVALNGGAPTVTNYTYNAANQLTGDGTYTYGYDDNGNLTTVNGTQLSTWDRANRLLSVSDGVTTTQYAYDGNGNRIKKTVGATISKYLLDIQPGLSVVLSETTGANVTRYVHGPRGIHGVKDSSNAWHWPVQDGLGSVRGVVDNSVGVQESRLYGPYGEPFGSSGTSQTSYGFTGEPTDANGLLYLRARYYNPTIGTFMSLDPFEGMWSEPMSLNGYGYVHANPVNWTDPSGAFVNILGGALLGAIFGAIGSALMYGLAVSGACGDKLKQQMECAGLGSALLTGAIGGAVAGALVGGLGPLGSAIAGGIGAGFAGYDILSNGPNLCNLLGLLGSVGGGLIGTGTVPIPTGINFEPFPLTPALQPVGGPSFPGISIPVPTGITWSQPIPIPVAAPVAGGAVGALYMADLNFKGKPYTRSPNGKYKGIYVTGRNGDIGQDMAEFDVIDTNGQGNFTEEKTAWELFRSDIAQLPLNEWELVIKKWVDENIIQETSRQINALSQGMDTRPTSPDDYLPKLDWFKDIKTFLFDVGAAKNNQLLQSYIYDGLSKLLNDYGTRGYIFKLK